MSLKNSTTKEPKAEYPGALSKIKKDLDTLARLSEFIMYLGKEMDTDGEITLRTEMLIDLAGKVEMAVDAIHYQLDPTFKDHREAMAQAGE